jgi:hypothetical protein
LNKSGSPEKAAAMWFGGPDYASHMGARDVLGTSIPQYMSRFSANAGRSGGDVVAADRGDEPGLISKASASGDAAPTVSASDSGEGQGLFGMKPFMNPDLAMYLMATGAGMAASRSRNPLQAFGEGALQGVEALQASRAGRGADALHAMQVQNLQSEINLRNAQTEELMRKVAARKRLLGIPSGEEPVSSDTGAPPTTAAPATVATPEVPKIVEEEETAPKSLEEKVAEGQKPSVEPSATPTPKATVSADPIDTEIAKASSKEKKFNLMAEQLLVEGLEAEAGRYEKLATDAANDRRTLMQEKRKTLTEKVGEGSPKDIYQKNQAAASKASDTLGEFENIRQILANPNVPFGPASELETLIKGTAKEAGERFPIIKNITGEIDPQAIEQFQTFQRTGRQMVLDALGGKLGAQISDGDRKFMEGTQLDASKGREYNIVVINKQEALQRKLIASAEEQENYRKAHGGLDSNFESHMAKWGREHPVQSYMRKEEEHRAGSIGKSSEPVSKDRTIVKRGKLDGRPVVQYSDGTTEYAD